MKNEQLDTRKEVKVMEPAVFTDGINVYTVNGVQTVSPTVYNTLLYSNAESVLAIEHLPKELRENYKEYVENGLSYIDKSNCEIFWNTFYISIGSRFSALLQKIHIEICPIDVVPDFDLSPIYNYIKLISSSPDMMSRADIMELMQTVLIPTWNMVGTKVYSEIMLDVVAKEAILKQDSNITEIVDKVNHEFAIFMSDSIYELVVLINRLGSAIIANVFTNKES